MIFRAKAPLRLGFGGGGSDVPPYVDKYGGFVLNATINKYVYVTLEINNTGEIGIYSQDYKQTIKYNGYKKLPYDGNLDLVKAVINKIKSSYSTHNLLNGNNGYNIYIRSDALPGVGLGTSSAVVVALLGVFLEALRVRLNAYEIAHLAWEIERIDMQMKGGKQDEYASTHGGVNFIEFHTNGEVIVNTLRLSKTVINELQHNLLLCYTGYRHTSSNIIKEQMQLTDERINILDHIKSIAVAMKEDLLTGELNNFGNLLLSDWQYKKKLSSKISNDILDNLADKATNAGAEGLKICLLPDTPIKVEDGVKFIKDINLKDKCLTSAGNYKKVINKLEKKYSGVITEIKPNLLCHSIFCTEGHEISIVRTNPCKYPKSNDRCLPNCPDHCTNKKYKKYEIKKVKAKDIIKDKDYLIYPINNTIKNKKHIEINQYSKYKKSKYSNCDPLSKIPENIPIDSNILQLFGLFIAEGSVNYGQTIFSLNKKEEYIRDFIWRTTKKYFCLTPTYHIHKNNKGMDVYINNVALSSFFKNLLPGNCYNKKIPKFIMYLNPKMQLYLLKGIFWGDGTKNGLRVVFTTASKSLASQICDILLRNGVVPHLSIGGCFTITINGKNASILRKFFVNNIKCKSFHKSGSQKGHIWNKKYLMMRIKEYRKHFYSGNVFDLTIDDVLHNYTTTSINVGNTGAGGGGVFIIYCNWKNKQQIAEVMSDEGCQIIDFTITKTGLETWMV